MRTILASLFLLVCLCLSAKAQQNCPRTPDAGTNNTTCANTAFVQKQLAAFPSSSLDALCSTDNRFLIRLSGTWQCGALPWADVTKFGAVLDGVTDNHTANANANAALTLLGGGVMLIPQGVDCDFSGFSSSLQRLTIMGLGLYTTVFDTCGHDVTTVNIDGAQSVIRDLVINGYNSPTATHPALNLTSNAVETDVEHVIFEFGSTPLANAAIDSRVRFTKAIYNYGNALVYNAAGNRWVNNKYDQPWPVATPANHSLTISAWAAATPYTVGNVVSITSGGRTWWIQCSHNGTSGSLQPAPQPYNITITDGLNGLTWLLANNANAFGMQLDTGASSTTIDMLDLTGVNLAGLAITNTLAGTAPEQIDISELSAAGVSWNVILEAGADVQITNSILNDCIGTSCSGIETTNSWASGLILTGSLIVNNSNGIYLHAGEGTIISNNMIVGNSGNGVFVDAGISNFIISSNTFYSTLYGANGTTIDVNTGSSDYYNIVNNIVHGSAPVDGGSGAHKTISGNN